MEPIIEVKNLGKKYSIAHMRGGYVALRDVIAGVARNPFSFLKNKAKQAVGMAKKEEFWALKGVNFTVNKGEVVGVIGANGAGKSTLLKVLSQITPPTEGEVVIRGRVGSLLEVGTGFHPELSGRENIFLNGAILGMKKREIEKKFDEIVAFAGIEKFLDTPVKHYSSGMYVRLAFSVAAHMEPDILLVDEVLAVGDAEFQKKCLGKMDEITKKEGRTIIFVSHNMTAVQSICKKCIILENGMVKDIGESQEIVEKYLSTVQNQAVKEYEKKVVPKEGQILKVSLKNTHGEYTGSIEMNEPFFVEIEYELKNDIPVYGIFKIFKPSIPGSYIFVTLSTDTEQSVQREKGKYKATVKIEPCLYAGTYSFLAGIASSEDRYIDRIVRHNAISIKNSGAFPFPVKSDGRTDSLVIMPFKWEISKIG